MPILRSIRHQILLTVGYRCSPAADYDATMSRPDQREIENILQIIVTDARQLKLVVLYYIYINLCPI